MLGDSFCKLDEVFELLHAYLEGFQSPCLGTLFASAIIRIKRILLHLRVFQSPCLGTLFASYERRLTEKERKGLSIPMLGDSFCKYVFCPREERAVTYLSIPMLGDSFCKLYNSQSSVWSHLNLSIPMLGDSFCKIYGHDLGVGRRYKAFNPHAWGLFLQGFLVVLPVFLTCVFQSPCLGTLFARYDMSTLEPEKKTFNPHAWGLFLQDLKGWLSPSLQS